MKKRLMSLMLCLLMVLSVLLTACGEDDSEVKTTTSKVTLTMLVVTDRQVVYTDEEYAALSAAEKETVDAARAQYEAVEKQINKVTKAKYNTALKIFYYTPEQYYEAVEQKMANTEIRVNDSTTASKLWKNLVRTEKRLGNTDQGEVYKKFAELYPEYVQYVEDPSAPVTTVEVEDEEEEIYPEVDKDQVDILFVGSYEKYVEYIEKDWLYKLNDSLNSSAKKLTSYVYPAFLNAVKYNKGYYAIPNNTLIGEYTALLLNKAMCDKYSDISQITSLYSALDLMQVVAKYESGYDPVWCNSYDGYTNVHFWSIDYEDVLDENDQVVDRTFTIDPTKFSVLGSSYLADYSSTSAEATLYPFSDILNDTGFVNQMVALKTIEVNGYKGAEGSEKPFAVGVIKGSGADIAAYEDEYYTVVLEKPVATQADLFDSMFAVSKYTSNLNRAMEIIVYLNTDADFRNLFQYGIKGVNYHLNGEDCAERLDDNLYDMDITKTGNMFIAYPDADKGMNYQTLNNAKLQDLDVVTNPTIGFTIEAADLPDLENLKTVLKASEDMYKEISECTSVEELKQVISDCVREIEGGMYKESIAQKAMNRAVTKDESGETEDLSAYALYYIWAKSMGFAS